MSGKTVHSTRLLILKLIFFWAILSPKILLVLVIFGPNRSLSARYELEHWSSMISVHFGVAHAATYVSRGESVTRALQHTVATRFHITISQCSLLFMCLSFFSVLSLIPNVIAAWSSPGPEVPSEQMCFSAAVRIMGQH